MRIHFFFSKNFGISFFLLFVSSLTVNASSHLLEPVILKRCFQAYEPFSTFSDDVAPLDKMIKGRLSDNNLNLKQYLIGSKIDS